MITLIKSAGDVRPRWFRFFWSLGLVCLALTLVGAAPSWSWGQENETKEEDNYRWEVIVIRFSTVIGKTTKTKDEEEKTPPGKSDRGEKEAEIVAEVKGLAIFSHSNPKSSVATVLMVEENGKVANREIIKRIGGNKPEPEEKKKAFDTVLKELRESTGNDVVPQEIVEIFQDKETKEDDHTPVLKISWPGKVAKLGGNHGSFLVDAQSSLLLNGYLDADPISIENKDTLIEDLFGQLSVKMRNARVTRLAMYKLMKKEMETNNELTKVQEEVDDFIGKMIEIYPYRYGNMMGLINVNEKSKLETIYNASSKIFAYSGFVIFFVFVASVFLYLVKYTQADKRINVIDMIDKDEEEILKDINRNDERLLKLVKKLDEDTADAIVNGFSRDFNQLGVDRDRLKEIIRKSLKFGGGSVSQSPNEEIGPALEQLDKYHKYLVDSIQKYSTRMHLGGSEDRRNDIGIVLDNVKSHMSSIKDKLVRINNDFPEMNNILLLVNEYRKDIENYSEERDWEKYGKMEFQKDKEKLVRIKKSYRIIKTKLLSFSVSFILYSDERRELEECRASLVSMRDLFFEDRQNDSSDSLKKVVEELYNAVMRHKKSLMKITTGRVGDKSISGCMTGLYHFFLKYSQEDKMATYVDIEKKIDSNSEVITELQNKLQRLAENNIDCEKKRSDIEQYWQQATKIIGLSGSDVLGGIKKIEELCKVIRGTREYIGTANIQNESVFKEMDEISRWVLAQIRKEDGTKLVSEKDFVKFLTGAQPNDTAYFMGEMRKHFQWLADTFKEKNTTSTVEIKHFEMITDAISKYRGIEKELSGISSGHKLVTIAEHCAGLVSFVNGTMKSLPTVDCPEIPRVARHALQEFFERLKNAAGKYGASTEGKRSSTPFENLKMLEDHIIGLNHKIDDIQNAFEKEKNELIEENSSKETEIKSLKELVNKNNEEIKEMERSIKDQHRQVSDHFGITNLLLTELGYPEAADLREISKRFAALKGNEALEEEMILRRALTAAIRVWNEALEKAKKNGAESFITAMKVESLQTKMEELLMSMGRTKNAEELWSQDLSGCYGSWVHRLWRLESLLSTYFWNRDELTDLKDASHLIGSALRLTFKLLGGSLKPVQLLYKAPEGARIEHVSDIKFDEIKEIRSIITSRLESGETDFVQDVLSFPWSIRTRDNAMATKGRVILVTPGDWK